MTLPVFLGRRASSELRDRLGYFSLIDPELARSLSNELSSTLERIPDHPYIYPHFAGAYRRAVLQRRSLGIFYEPKARLIFVAAIVDLRRDPAVIRHRLGRHESASEFVAGPTMAPPFGMSYDSAHKSASDPLQCHPVETSQAPVKASGAKP